MFLYFGSAQPPSSSEHLTVVLIYLAPWSTGQLFFVTAFTCVSSIEKAFIMFWTFISKPSPLARPLQLLPPLLLLTTSPSLVFKCFYLFYKQVKEEAVALEMFLGMWQDWPSSPHPSSVEIKCSSCVHVCPNTGQLSLSFSGSTNGTEAGYSGKNRSPSTLFWGLYVLI